MTINRDTRVSRRNISASAAGFAAGRFATSLRHAAAQQASPVAENATPVPMQPAGFVSMRIRTVESSEARAQVNELVAREFAPDVVALEGFEGYLLGNVIDNDVESLSILVMKEEAQTASFDALAADFVSEVEDSVTTVGTVEWSGELLIAGRPTAGDATPVATPVGPVFDGYVAARVYTSTPGTDPRDFVPLVISGFLPIVSGLEGFQGYLFYPTDEGFVSISFFDSAESAEQSNEAGQEWAAEFLSEYTDAQPDIINATVVYRNMPILR